MSRVLRRPMFRMGGPVDSYNTGIVSGLDDEGYADGGQIGGGIIYGNRMMDGRYGFQSPYIPRFDIDPYVSEYRNIILDPEKVYKEKIGKVEEETADTGYMFDPSGLTPIVPARAKTKEESKLLSPVGKEITMREVEERNKSQIEKLKQDIAYMPLDQQKEIFKQLKLPVEFLQPRTPSSAPSEDIDRKRDVVVDPMEKQLKNIERFSDAYRKMLGYEDSRSQALYDFLGDIAPATASGKTKAEAFQEMLKAAQKSEAFKTPRNIRQAATKLAIERESLISAQRAKGEGDISKIISQATAATGKEMLKSMLGEQGSAVLYLGGLTGSQIKESLKQNPSYVPPNARPGILYQTSDGRFFKVLQDPKSKRQVTEFYPFTGI